LFLHVARDPGDLDLWCAQTIIYLPGGEVLADRSFGRAPHDRGPCSGNLDIQCLRPHERWTLTFDGAGERTTREETSRRVVGAGPSTPAKFAIEVSAVGPVWDWGEATGMNALLDPSESVWAAKHQEQGFLATGTIEVGGERFEVDGVAYRDHSWGQREMSDFGGDAFVCIVFPESRRVVQGFEMWNSAGELQTRTFYIAEGDQLELIDEGTVPRAVDWLSNPRTDLTVQLRRAGGELITLKGEVLNGVTTSMLTPNFNVNGASPPEIDPLNLNEDLIRYTWPDGEPGYGHSERSLRFKDL
jgi:hypothetical protein